jgi:hypothetical protein
VSAENLTITNTNRTHQRVSKQAWPDSVASQKAGQITPEQYDFDVPKVSKVHQMGSCLSESLCADPE